MVYLQCDNKINKLKHSPNDQRKCMYWEPKWLFKYNNGKITQFSHNCLSWIYMYQNPGSLSVLSNTELARIQKPQRQFQEWQEKAEGGTLLQRLQQSLVPAPPSMALGTSSTGIWACVTVPSGFASSWPSSPPLPTSPTTPGHSGGRIRWDSWIKCDLRKCR